MISPQALIDPSASIAPDVEIGPYTTIGPKVIIDSGCKIGSHVVINGATAIGRNTQIFQFASIGDEPQDKTYQGEDTRLEIGENNIIREYCMINRGTVKGGGLTKIMDNNFFMAYSHVGHDSQIHNHTIFTNCAALAGHVTVEDYAIIGGYSAVHQHCTVGAHSFIARATYVTKDVLPYMMIAGHDARACGLNSVGLKRRGFSTEALELIRRAYKIIFRQQLTVSDALEALSALEPIPEIKLLISHLEKSERGIVR